MLKLMRTIGAAVIMGLGAKAGSDLYEVLRERARRSREDAARDATVDGEASSSGPGRVDPSADPSEDLEETEARLKAERERINRELDRLRRKRGRR